MGIPLRVVKSRCDAIAVVGIVVVVVAVVVGGIVDYGLDLPLLLLLRRIVVGIPGIGSGSVVVVVVVVVGRCRTVVGRWSYMVGVVVVVDDDDDGIVVGVVVVVDIPRLDSVAY